MELNMLPLCLTFKIEGKKKEVQPLGSASNVSCSIQCPAHSWGLTDINYIVGALGRAGKLLVPPRCEVEQMMEMNTVKAAHLPASQEGIT